MADKPETRLLNQWCKAQLVDSPFRVATHRLISGGEGTHLSGQTGVATVARAAISRSTRETLQIDTRCVVTSPAVQRATGTPNIVIAVRNRTQLSNERSGAQPSPTTQFC
jgi:hypothetical protein